MTSPLPRITRLRRSSSSTTTRTGVGATSRPVTCATAATRARLRRTRIRRHQRFPPVDGAPEGPVFPGFELPLFPPGLLPPPPPVFEDEPPEPGRVVATRPSKFLRVGEAQTAQRPSSTPVSWAIRREGPPDQGTVNLPQIFAGEMPLMQVGACQTARVVHLRADSWSQPTAENYSRPHASTRRTAATEHAGTPRCTRHTTQQPRRSPSAESSNSDASLYRSAEASRGIEEMVPRVARPTTRSGRRQAEASDAPASPTACSNPRSSPLHQRDDEPAQPSAHEAAGQQAGNQQPPAPTVRGSDAGIEVVNATAQRTCSSSVSARISSPKSPMYS